MLAGFRLHVGQIKLFACFIFFSGIVEQLLCADLFVYKRTRKSNQKNRSPIFDSDNKYGSAHEIFVLITKARGEGSVDPAHLCKLV